jgi:geranylgeranyl reductase family protein
MSTDVAVTDVAIVGAGPSGSAAAITLAHAGRHVLLVDKATFPRDKFCGDGLTSGALSLLEELGLDLGALPSWREVTDFRIRTPRGRIVHYPLPRGQGVFAGVARRMELDAALVELARAAGVEVIEGHAVTGAVQSPERVSLEVDGIGPVHARHVIGADGMWSPLRRLLGLDRPGYRGEWHAFRQYVRGVEAPADRELWILFERDLLPAYFWSFPVGDGGANIGFGIRRGGALTTRDMKALWPDILARPHVRELLGPDAEPEGPHRAWPIPAAVDGTILTDGRVLFVGDAIAAADPMSGEGIGQALATGRWAAEAILTGSATWPIDVTRRYEARVRRDLGRDQRFAATLSHTLAHPLGAELAIGLSGLTAWTRGNFARWLFEDYPRAAILTPDRWSRTHLRPTGAYR